MSVVADELPDGWIDTPLSMVVACSTEKVEPGENDEAPYLSLEHIESNSCRILGHGLGSDVKSTKNVFRTGDVLYGKLRPYLNKVCRPNFDGMCSTDILVLRPSEALDPGYMFRILTSALFVAHAVANSNGINLPRTSFTALGEFEIGLPPLPEQRRIVAKIEALQARSRKAREALEAIPPLLEQFRQSVLAAAFRGDLTADWREQHPEVEPASVLLERIRAQRREKWEQAELAKFKAKGKVPKDDSWKEKYVESEPVDDSDLPELPEGWCWAAAEEIVEPEAEIMYGIVQPGPKLAKGVPYVRGCDIQDGVIQVEQLLFTSKEIAKRYQRASLKGGDVLLGIIRATKVAIVPSELDGANITQGTARFRPSIAITTDFLAGWLDTPFAQGWLHGHYRGIDMPGLNLRDVRRLPVPLAPRNEQQAVTSALNKWRSSYVQLRDAVESSSSEVSNLDQSILAKAFRGELVPQDPSDEPASVLLERIRTERAAETTANPARRASPKSKPKRQRGTLP